MELLHAVAILLVAVAAWVGGSHVGMRRTRMSQSNAERRAETLGAELLRMRIQVEAEQALLERLPEPVVLFGENGEVLRRNAATRRTLGVGVPALLRHPRFRAALERARDTGIDQFAEISLPVPISRELLVSVLVMDGSRMLATLSDRTREQAVERMRADFVANASHELRTPLTSLIGFIDTLRGAAADDPAAQSRFLGIMAEQAQRMNRLIDDLLSLSRIEMTEHVPPSERVSVAELIERVGAGFGPLLNARKTVLDADVPPALPDVTGDEDQLAQVMQNLLENAIKYGKEAGHVRISAAAAARAAQAGVAIRVEDDGMGISATHLPRLTERFYRVNTRRSRDAGGTGLGLAIVKHIVNRHRGHLRIDSVEGDGTTVTVWLPAAAPGNGNPSAPAGFGR